MNKRQRKKKNKKLIERGKAAIRWFIREYSPTKALIEVIDLKNTEVDHIEISNLEFVRKLKEASGKDEFEIPFTAVIRETIRKGLLP